MADDDESLIMLELSSAGRGDAPKARTGSACGRN